jgi:hypothetical protein
MYTHTHTESEDYLGSHPLFSPPNVAAFGVNDAMQQLSLGDLVTFIPSLLNKYCLFAYHVLDIWVSEMSK